MEKVIEKKKRKEMIMEKKKKMEEKIYGELKRLFKKNEVEYLV